MVTVTVSIDCLAFDGAPAAAVLAVVMTSWPHRAKLPPYCACCWMPQAGTLAPPGIVSTIELSDQVVMLDAGTRYVPIITVPCVAPKP